MTELKIEGMHCASCVALLEEALTDIPGVRKARVTMGRANVEHDKTVRKEALIAAVQAEGYRAEEM